MDYVQFDIAHLVRGFEKEASLRSALMQGLGATSMAGLKRAVATFRRGSQAHGPESFLADALLMPLPKKLKLKIKRSQWRHISEPAMKADTIAGHYLRKIPGAKGLFTLKEQVRTGPHTYKDVERASALAPLIGARNLAVPIIAGSAITDYLSKKTEKTGSAAIHSRGTSDMIDNRSNTRTKEALDMSSPELREKVASTMLRLNDKNKEYEKRAQAIKLMYKQAELGIAILPSSYAEFEEKVASISCQDLTVLEKALELATGDVKLGELSGNDPTKHDPAATFQSSVLE